MIFKYKNPNYSSIKYTTISKEDLIKTRKIKLYPNENQRNYMQKWIELSRQIYNIIVGFLNKNIFDKEGKPVSEKVKEYVNSRKLRDEYLKEEKKN